MSKFYCSLANKGRRDNAGKEKVQRKQKEEVQSHVMVRKHGTDKKLAW